MEFINNKVAVIMSIYKNDKICFLSEAVDSLFNQTIGFDLYLCVDGYIPDDLSFYITSIADRNNIYIVNNSDNIGLAKSLNRLIDKIIDKNYEFVARMDSDDRCDPERFKKQVDYFESNSEVDVLGTACKEFGSTYALDVKRLPTSHVQLENFSIARCPFIHPSVMFRKSVFDEGVRYPTSTNYTEDMALWFHLLSSGYVFANLEDILLEYRLDENTVERRRGLAKLQSEITLRIRYMVILKKISAKNLFLIASRVIIHLAPSFIVKTIYAKARKFQ